jgi:hypothetical protein
MSMEADCWQVVGVYRLTTCARGGAREALLCMATIGLALSCHAGAASHPTPTGSVAVLPDSRAFIDSGFRCADGVPIELASGHTVTTSQMCIARQRDTSYVVAYAGDHQLILRMATWNVPGRAVDSVVGVLSLSLDQDHGVGRACVKRGAERYWGSPPHVLLLTVSRPDLPSLPASLSLAEEAAVPDC